MIVAAVYFIFFAPDPFADVKFFLDNEGKTYGSYDENKEAVLTVPPPETPKPPLKDVLQNGVPKAPGTA